MTEHYPGKLSVDGEYCFDEKGNCIVNCDTDNASKKRMAANAARIGLAWNSHTALVVLLAEARDSLAGGLESEGWELEAEFSKSDRKLIARIDAALALATPKDK